MRLPRHGACLAGLVPSRPSPWLSFLLVPAGWPHRDRVAVPAGPVLGDPRIPLRRARVLGPRRGAVPGAVVSLTLVPAVPQGRAEPLPRWWPGWWERGGGGTVSCHVLKSLWRAWQLAIRACG